MLPIRHKTPLKSRTLSPSQHFLSPNNDDFERAQARAARAAAQRRKSFVGLDAQNAGLSRLKSVGDEDVLSKDQILDLLNNCIKLATENKINQRNTWELRLIDHISEIVKAGDGGDAETNFQKASCTLEAGVKIYSYRVDSVHSETFKVLGGLNRTAADDGVGVDNDIDQSADEEEENANKKKDIQKKVATSSATLESYEALNVKKFDVAFTVDPLFHQTSAQFDEGGAKGLLLNTLSVYSGCTLAFDSNDVPASTMKYGITSQCPSESVKVDLSSMKDCFQRVKLDMQVETEISPTLREIFMMLDDPYRAAIESEGIRQTAELKNDNQSNSCEEELGEVIDGGAFDHINETLESVNDESVAEISTDCVTWDSDAAAQDDKEDNFSTHDTSSIDDDFMVGTHLVNWITRGFDLPPSNSNAWAGPDHWKFKRTQEGHKSSEESNKSTEKKKIENEKFSFDFMHPPKIDMSAFAPVADGRSLMMPQRNIAVSTLLPEDCHYQAEDLVRLYLQPAVMCINQLGKKKSGTRRRSNGEVDMQWDNSSTADVVDGWNDENILSDAEDSENVKMIPQPRKVQKIEVNYDKTSKQIDVRVLKETLWKSLQEMPSSNSEFSSHEVSFRSLLNYLPADSEAAASSEISVHLCFICLLHLANEHNLRIEDCKSLDELYIHNISAEYCGSNVTSC